MQWFKRYAVYFRKGSKFQSIVKWANEYVPYFTYDVFDYFCPFLFSFSRLNNSSRQKNRRLPNLSKERERENMTSTTPTHTHTQRLKVLSCCYPIGNKFSTISCWLSIHFVPLFFRQLCLACAVILNRSR